MSPSLYQRDTRNVVPRERREILPQYVRRANGNLFQVRIYVAEYAGQSHGRPLNFGLFRSIGAAERASIKVLKLLAAKKTPWEALRLLQLSGDLPAHILPTYVYRHPGEGFGARVAKRGRDGARVVLECPGPYETAEAAYGAMVAKIKQWEARNTDRPVKRLSKRAG